MGLDVAGVYHQPLEIRVIHHFLQQSGPHTSVPPAAEAAVGVLPVSVVRGQIAPGSAGAQNPANGVDKPPVVMGRPTSLAFSPGRYSLSRSQTPSVISWRRCAAVIPPPSTLSPFTEIYHPTTILTTPLGSCIQSALAKAGHVGQDLFGGLGPDKGLGVFVGKVKCEFSPSLTEIFTVFDHLGSAVI